MPSSDMEWRLLARLVEEVRSNTLSASRKEEAENTLEKLADRKGAEQTLREFLEAIPFGRPWPAGLRARLASSGTAGDGTLKFEPPPKDWLQHYLQAALASNLCISMSCGLCGSMPFQTGLVLLASRDMPKDAFRVDHNTSLKIAAALAKLVPPSQLSLSLEHTAMLDPTAQPKAYRAFLRPWDVERAVMSIIYLLWSRADASFETQIAPLLAGSYAGTVLGRMHAHYAAAQARRRAYEVSTDPKNVRKYREDRKKERQQRHAERLARKRERDKDWWARQGRRP